MTAEIITVFGGSGFVGRNVVRELARAGYRVRVAVRTPKNAHFLQPMGNVGQIGVMYADIRDDATVARAVHGASAVINLVGILFERGKQKFAALQAEGAERIAEKAKAAGVGRFIQVSAIGADAGSESVYARTKAEGETRVRNHYPDVTVLRPSIVFGPEDDFFNRFASMATIAPALPLVGGGKTRFQPVHVDDVADAVVRCLSDPKTKGRIYELGGPSVMTFRECLELMLRVIERKRLLVPLPFPIASLMGSVAQWVPFGAPVITADQVKLLRHDNVVGLTGDERIGTLEDLGITPNAPEAILPTYLYRFRKHGQYDSGYGRK